MKVPAIKGGKPVRKEFLVFGKPDIQKAEIDEVVDTLKSGWIGTGPKTMLLEKKFAKYCNSRHAVSVNSCTAGLFLALKAFGVSQGDEVITSPLTFAATANVIEHLGAKPVFVDVEKSTGNIDTALIEEKVSEKTKAIMPVHLYGRPCDMEKITATAKKHSLKVLEDAAHAVEAEFNGKKIGSISDATAFSFYATKNMTTAEGGMVTTGDSALAERLSVLRLHGISKDAWKRYSSEGFKPYDVLEPGYKYNLTDLQASLGLHQFERLEKNLKKRKAICKKYEGAFSKTEGILLMDRSEKGLKDARHLFTILIEPEKLKIDRNNFIEALRAEGIGSGIHFLSLHESSYYRQKYGYRKEDFPNATFISDRTISLPLAPNLSEKDTDNVIEAVQKIVSFFKK
ncbi:MAG: DegT/DnrJ/EryC1/StrS family aminotransferase [Candidatus Diapherotrites archaeon]